MRAAKYVFCRLRRYRPEVARAVPSTEETGVVLFVYQHLWARSASGGLEGGGFSPRPTFCR